MQEIQRKKNWEYLKNLTSYKCFPWWLDQHVVSTGLAVIPNIYFIDFFRNMYMKPVLIFKQFSFFFNSCPENIELNLLTDFWFLFLNLVTFAIFCCCSQKTQKNLDVSTQPFYPKIPRWGLLIFLVISICLENILFSVRYHGRNCWFFQYFSFA